MEITRPSRGVIESILEMKVTTTMGKTNGRNQRTAHYFHIPYLCIRLHVRDHRTTQGMPSSWGFDCSLGEGENVI